jgi:hypothetical protein
MVSRIFPFLLALGLAACNGGQAVPPTQADAGVDSGDPLGGKTPMQLCLEACTLEALICQPNLAGTCESYCTAHVMDGAPFCEDLVGLWYACNLQQEKSRGCGTEWKACDDLRADAYECQLVHGCGDATSSCDQYHAPCNCLRECDSGKTYEVKCIPDSMSAGMHCDCYADDVLLGSCEQPDDYCYIYQTCCRAQYFNF